MPTVLITGTSIAGPSLAFWLRRYGWHTTLVERAPAFRDGGQNIDVRGAGREVLRRAGLEDTVRAATTGERGTRFVDEHGATVAEFPAGRSDTEGATAEVEVLRGDLARILLDAAGDERETIFDDSVTGIADDGDAAEVTLAHRGKLRFDLVIVAEGLGSSTRALVFGDDVAIRALGLEMTYLTLDRTAGDVDWWRWYTAPGGRSVTLRPDRHGTTRAVLTEVTGDRGTRPAGDRRGADLRSAEEQRDHLRARFRDAGWEAPRVLAALDGADDLYYESIGQVLAPSWHRGRVALLGDAAWCASPVSGMGTTLALVGAYVLAGELAAHVHHRDAFLGYERIMRPYVSRAQHLGPGVPRIANPVTRSGVAAFRLGLRAAARLPQRVRSAGLFSPPADELELPNYIHLSTPRLRLPAKTRRCWVSFSRCART
jgi:2-polyprenyl-6-methoxyphenol hydroxylase-like FAD-dependent oxidoreductase